MEALILAGGLGTRLRPLTLTVPKPLVPVANVPIVRRIIDKLPPEVERVRLAVNYKVDALRAYFEDAALDREVVLVEEQEPLGTGGAVRNAADGLDEPFLVFNGDVLDSLDLSAFVQFHRNHGGAASVALWKVRDPRPFGIVDLDGSRIRSFVEKPASKDEAPSSLANAGTYVLDPSVLDHIPEGRRVSLEREVFPQLLANNRAMHGYAFTGHWIDVGRPESYLKANEIMLRQLGKKAVIGRNVRYEGVELTDWAAIGDDCDLAGDCEIARSVLMHGVKVAGNAAVKNSILAPGVRVEEDAAVVDCVLGEGAIVRKGLLAKNLTAEPGEVIGDSDSSGESSQEPEDEV